jgi:hypothetical protein
MGMKFFMCANHAHDPPESSLLFYRASVRFKFDEMTYLLMLYLDVSVRLFLLQSPPPLCQWYYWIDTEQPAWALRQIEERKRRAWERFQEEEREEAAQRKAAQEAYNEEKRQRITEGKHRRKAEEERRKHIRETERERKKERAAHEEAAEKRGDTTGKWPRWTQD